jgi:hypothetical protein
MSTQEAIDESTLDDKYSTIYKFDWFYTKNEFKMKFDYEAFRLTTNIAFPDIFKGEYNLEDLIFKTEINPIKMNLHKRFMIIISSEDFAPAYNNKVYRLLAITSDELLNVVKIFVKVKEELIEKVRIKTKINK